MLLLELPSVDDAPRMGVVLPLRRHPAPDGEQLVLHLEAGVSLLEWSPPPPPPPPVPRTHPPVHPHRLAPRVAVPVVQPVPECSRCPKRDTCRSPCAALEQLFAAEGMPAELMEGRERSQRPEVVEFLASVRAVDRVDNDESEQTAWDWDEFVEITRPQLDAAIEVALPQVQRETLRMFLGGMRPIDIARHRGVKKPNVSIALRRARVNLRRHLGAQT